MTPRLFRSPSSVSSFSETRMEWMFAAFWKFSSAMLKACCFFAMSFLSPPFFASLSASRALF